MHSNAQSVDDYLNSLPEERRSALTTVRNTILKNLPNGYEETMNWGMISYEVPLRAYPDTYNKKPLMYAALASQKNHMAVYLTGIYVTPEEIQKFKNDYKATGKKLDMGVSCVRFKRIDDLPLELIGQYIAKVTMDMFIEAAKQARTK